jgi:Ca2+-binding RTX toxin-like protein
LNVAAVTADSILDLSGGTSQIGGVGVSLVAPHTFQGLFAGDGDDRLIGNALDNQLMGGRGSNLIDGGAGTDSALYIGGRSLYSVQLSDQGYEVVSNVLSGGGTDQLIDIESFNFGTTSLLVKSALDQTQTIASYYDAMFNRGADGQGLRYWVDDYFEQGMSESQIAQGFANASEDDVASLTIDEFVTRLYEFALERNPDEAGFEYWTSQLETQQASRGSVLLNFVISEEFVANRLDVVAVQVSQLGDIWA